jgi:hypothetical protein
MFADFSLMFIRTMVMIRDDSYSLLAPSISQDMGVSENVVFPQQGHFIYFMGRWVPRFSEKHWTG